MSLIIDAMDQCELNIYEYLILKASQKWMAELLTSLFLSIAIFLILLEDYKRYAIS